MTWWFVYEWGKLPRQKPHWLILRSPHSRIHYYHNKWLQVKESQYLIPTYSWTLTPIPNWTCSVVTISHFQCTAPSMWLTNQCTDLSMWLTTNLRRMLVAKFFSSSTRWRSWSSLVTKPYGVQMQQLLDEKDELGQIVFGHNMLMKNLCIKLHLLASAVIALKIIHIYVRVLRKESPTMYTRIGLK